MRPVLNLSTVIFLFSLFLVSPASFGNNIDTLEANLDKAETPFEIAKANYFIALYYSNNEAQKAEPYVKNCIKVISLTDSIGHLGKAYKLSGYIHYQLNNYKEAGKNYLYGAKYFTEAKDNLNASRCYIDFAVQALHSNNIRLGEKYLQIALKASMPDLGNADLGIAYLLLGNLNRAKGMHKQALNAYKEAQIYLGKEHYNVNIGITATLIDLGRFDEANKTFDAIESNTFQKAGFDSLAVQVEKLRLLQFQGKHTAALALASKLMPATQAYADLKAAVLYAQWGVYKQSQQIAQATTVANELVAFGQQHQLNNHLLNFLPPMAAFGEANGQHALANSWNKLQNQIQKAVLMPQVAQQEDMRTSLALAEQEFKAELRLAAVQAQNRHNALIKNIMLGVLAVLTLLVLFILRLMYKYRFLYTMVLPAYRQDPVLTNVTLKRMFTPKLGVMFIEVQENKDEITKEKEKQEAQNNL